MSATVSPSWGLERIHHRATWVATQLARVLPRGPIVERRRANYQRFAARLGGLGGAHPLRPDLPDDCAPYVFPLWVADPDPLYHALRCEGFPILRWDITWPGTPVLPEDVGHDWQRHVLQLLCHQDLSTADVDTVCDAICERLPHALKPPSRAASVR